MQFSLHNRATVRLFSHYAATYSVYDFLMIRCTNAEDNNRFIFLRLAIGKISNLHPIWSYWGERKHDFLIWRKKMATRDNRVNKSSDVWNLLIRIFHFPRTTKNSSRLNYRRRQRTVFPILLNYTEAGTLDASVVTKIYIESFIRFSVPLSLPPNERRRLSLISPKEVRILFALFSNYTCQNIHKLMLLEDYSVYFIVNLGKKKSTYRK